VGGVGLIGKQPDANCRYWLRYWDDCGRERRELVRQTAGSSPAIFGRRDEDGYFWFEGRADDMIKERRVPHRGPFEVESALLKHPACRRGPRSSASPTRCGGRSSRPTWCLRPGLRGSEELSQELARSVKATLGKHQYPREFRVCRHPAQDGDRQDKALRPARRARVRRSRGSRTLQDVQASGAVDQVDQSALIDEDVVARHALGAPRESAAGTRRPRAVRADWRYRRSSGRGRTRAIGISVPRTSSQN